jgi:hypothetical protein
MLARPISTQTSVLIVMLLVLVSDIWSDKAHAQQPRADCPSPSAASYPFDNTSLRIDSLFRASARAGNIVYCVQIDGARHPYLVNWPDVQWQDVATSTDGYLGGLSTEITRRVDLQETQVYVGANQRRFTPNIWKEVTLAQEFIDTARTLFTRFLGSIRLKTSMSEDAADFVSVDLDFQSSYRNETGHLEFINEEKGPSRPVRFRFSEAVRQRIPELREPFTVGPNRSVTQYKISGQAVAERVNITFMNSDNQDVGSIPIAIYGSLVNR